MHRLLQFWLAPAVAALLASYVLATWALRLWLRAPEPQSAPASVAWEVFPNAPGRASAPTTHPNSAPAHISLIGTVIPRDASEAKRAVLKMDGKSLDLEQGAQLADGTTLVRVERRAVVLSQAGKEQRIELAKINPQPAAATRTGSAPPPTTPALTIASGCPATAEQKRSGVVLNTELLAGALQNQSSVDSVLAPVGNGLTVRNSAGIGALLSLRDGDIIRSVGGARVAQARDLVTFALIPLSKAQLVNVELERSGAVQVLTFLPPGCR